MKKLMTVRNILLIAVLFFVLSNCTKDKENYLIGTWTIAEYSVDVTVNGTDIIEYLMQEMGMSQNQAELYASFYTASVMSGTIEFHDDGSFEANTNGDIYNGTWELSSDNSQLIFDAGTDDEQIMDVESLKRKEMILSFSETDSYDINGDDTDDNLVVDARLTLEKE